MGVKKLNASTQQEKNKIKRLTKLYAPTKISKYNSHLNYYLKILLQFDFKKASNSSRETVNDDQHRKKTLLPEQTIFHTI